MMLRSMEGIYHHGRVELAEMPFKIHEPTHVIVRFLESNSTQLQTQNLNKIQAADLRARLSTFAEDWDKLEMDIYDNYDANKSNL